MAKYRVEKGTFQVAAAHEAYANELKMRGHLWDLETLLHVASELENQVNGQITTEVPITHGEAEEITAEDLLEIGKLLGSAQAIAALGMLSNQLFPESNALFARGQKD